MWFKCTSIAITILLLAGEVVSQECTEIRDEKTAAQFLVDHKTNSRAADRHCVDGAFATLADATEFRNKNYIAFLVGMLDFERWTPEEYAQASEPKYPAINILHHLNGGGKNVVPYLIKGVKESNSKLLRANAAETLYYSVSTCGALKILTRETENTDITYEQRERLEAAIEQVKGLSHSSVPCN